MVVCSPMASLKVHIPDDLNEELSALSSTLDRTKAYIIRKAIQEYIKNLKLEGKTNEENSRETK
jgi:predicted DNA-binding protein